MNVTERRERYKGPEGGRDFEHRKGKDREREERDLKDSVALGGW